MLASFIISQTLVSNYRICCNGFDDVDLRRRKLCAVIYFYNAGLERDIVLNIDGAFTSRVAFALKEPCVRDNITYQTRIPPQRLLHIYVQTYFIC